VSIKNKSDDRNVCPNYKNSLSTATVIFLELYQFARLIHPARPSGVDKSLGGGYGEGNQSQATITSTGGTAKLTTLT